VIVLDASAVVDWLLQTAAGQRIERRFFSRSQSLHAPHLLDLEVAQVLRRLVRKGAVSARRADEAVQDLLDLRINRYPHSDRGFGNSVTICRHTMRRTLCSPKSLAPPCSLGTGGLAPHWVTRYQSNCFDWSAHPKLSS
jgi:predicted nucleic acid-binding protein